MSYASWSILTISAASCILAAWLGYKVKILSERLRSRESSLAEANRRSAELSAALVQSRVDIQKLQKVAVSQYEILQKTVGGSTPGVAIRGMREIFAAKDDSNPADAVRGSTDAPAKGED